MLSRARRVVYIHYLSNSSPALCTPTVSVPWVSNIIYIILYRTVTLPLGYLLSGRWYRGAPHRQFHQIIAAYRVSTTCNKYVHASLFSHMVRVIVAMPQYGGALQPALRPVQPGWIYFFSILIDTMCIL